MNDSARDDFNFGYPKKDVYHSGGLVLHGKRSKEAINLLFHCEVARELWDSIFHLFGVE